MYNFDKNVFMMGDGCTCGCGCNAEHNHEHEHEHEHEENIVTMVEEETGTEYQFSVVDEFDFEGEVYCVLLTLDDEPEALIVKVITDENGEEFFMSLEEDEYDRVAAEYEKILEETEDEESENKEEA